MPLLDPKYLEAKQALLEGLSRLRSAAEPLADAVRTGLLVDAAGRVDECRRLVDDESAKLSAGRFRIGLFGLVKAGKSTLINALAEQYVSEVDSLPATTAALHLVRRTGAPIVHFLPASRKPQREISRDEAVRLLDEKGNPDNVEQVDFVDVPAELRYLEEDIVLVDTPGLGYLLRAISDRAGRELHESVHAVVLVARVFGGQLWQREVRDFLAEAVQRVPRIFVVVNCNETRDDEWGQTAFGRIRDRFALELREANRALRAALDDGLISLHFLSALQAASALLRLRKLTGDSSNGTSPSAAPEAAPLQAELEASRFPEFRSALAGFAGSDKRLWDDLRFRARTLATKIESVRESLRATVVTHLEADRQRTDAEIAGLTGKLGQLEASIAEVKQSAALETDDLVGELIDKAQSKTDEFMDETVQPAVNRWFGTSDTPAELQAELDRQLVAWRPQLQGFLDKRRQVFAKRLGLKIRSELFHRLGVTVEVEPEVAVELADAAKLPGYDLTSHFERGLSAWLLILLALVVGGLLAWICGPDPTNRVLGAGLSFAAVTGVGFLVVRNAMAGAFRSFLHERSLPAMVKSLFHERAIRQLVETKAEMRRMLKEALSRRREDIAAKVGAAVATLLDAHRVRLEADWTRQRGELTTRAEKLRTLSGQATAFVAEADRAVIAATHAAT